MKTIVAFTTFHPADLSRVLPLLPAIAKTDRGYELTGRNLAANNPSYILTKLASDLARSSVTVIFLSHKTWSSIEVIDDVYQSRAKRPPNTFLVIQLDEKVRLTAGSGPGGEVFASGAEECPATPDAVASAMSRAVETCRNTQKVLEAIPQGSSVTIVQGGTCSPR